MRYLSVIAAACLSLACINSAQAAEKPRAVMVITQGYGGQFISTSYHPLVMTREQCIDQLLTELKSQADASAAVSHFTTGGKYGLTGEDRAMFEIQAAGSAFRIVAECRPVPFR